MEPKGIEPSTSALRTKRHPCVSVGNKDFTEDGAEACTNACTNACTDWPNLTHEGGTESTFPEALAMIARLLLSHAEKAEAVRHLLISK